jgi:hypothetical protein
MNKKLKRLIAGLSVIAGSLLGAYGGAHKTSKGWRRVGIPLLLILLSFLFGHGWYSLIFLGWFLPIGYGIPNKGDGGSTLGKFWCKYTKGEQPISDILVRGTIGLLRGLILAIFAHTAGFRGLAILSIALCVIAGISSIWWRKLGTIQLLGKELIWDELGVWGSYTLVVLIPIIM